MLFMRYMTVLVTLWGLQFSHLQASETALEIDPFDHGRAFLDSLPDIPSEQPCLFYAHLLQQHMTLLKPHDSLAETVHQGLWAQMQARIATWQQNGGCTEEALLVHTAVMTYWGASSINPLLLSFNSGVAMVAKILDHFMQQGTLPTKEAVEAWEKAEEASYRLPAEPIMPQEPQNPNLEDMSLYLQQLRAFNADFQDYLQKFNYCLLQTTAYNQYYRLTDPTLYIWKCIPWVAPQPLFGFITHARAMAQGIQVIGFPTSQSVSVHTDLVRGITSVALHDALHVQEMLLNREDLKVEEAIEVREKMQQQSWQALAQAFVPLLENRAEGPWKKTAVLFFLVTHELISHPTLPTVDKGAQAICDAVILHAQGYLTALWSPDAENVAINPELRRRLSWPFVEITQHYGASFAHVGNTWSDFDFQKARAFLENEINWLRDTYRSQLPGVSS